MGAYAAQIVKRRGVAVIACGRSADGTFAAEIAGADEYLISDVALVGAIRSRYPNGVDGVIDTAMLGDEVLGAVRDGGTFVSMRIDAMAQSNAAYGSDSHRSPAMGLCSRPFRTLPHEENWPSGSLRASH